MIFKTGDRVKIKEYEDLDVKRRCHVIPPMFSGKYATVKDRLYSENLDSYTYYLHIEEYGDVPFVAFKDCDLESAVKTACYEYEFEFLENVVVARLYEVCDESRLEIGKGHGHIFHEGAYGAAQAASYALKKIAENMNGGSFKKGGTGT